MGVPWGAPNDLNTLMAMVNAVPDDWTWSAFSLGRDQMPFVAAAVLAGGNVRVGLEDNLFLDRGVLATNAQLVDRAVTLIETMGAKVIGPAAVRERLGLVKRAPVSTSKVCPECGYVFQGKGWDGIDAHWKAKHEDIMAYETAWPQLRAGTYKSVRTS
jgi:hypothetical protein